MNGKPQKMFNVKLNMIQGKNLLVQRNNAYEINGIGLQIWELCNGSLTIEEIAKELTQEYDCTYDVLLGDCQSFVQDLTKLGLIEL